jgi:hypothetical protein
MKISEIVDQPAILSEGYKLSKTEIDHLFKVIADARYDFLSRKTDKAKKYASGAASDIKDVYNSAKGAVSGYSDKAKEAGSRYVDKAKTAGTVASGKLKSAGSEAASKLKKATSAAHGEKEVSNARAEQERRRNATVTVNSSKILPNDRMVNEGPLKDLFSTAKNSTKTLAKEIANVKPDTTYENIVNVWKTKYGETTDSDEIINMLKQEFNMANRGVMAAMKKVAEDKPLIRKLAKQIKSLGLTDQVLAYLKDPKLYVNKDNTENGKFNRRRGRNDRAFRESAFNSKDNSSRRIVKISETTMTDNHVRDLLSKVIKNPEFLVKKETGQSTDGYFDTWNSEFNKTNDLEVKMKLVSDAVDKMVDITDKAEKNNYKNKLIAKIKGDGVLSSNKMFVDAATVKIQNNQKMKESIHERVEHVKEMVMYGRRKKK